MIRKPSANIVQSFNPCRHPVSRNGSCAYSLCGKHWTNDHVGRSRPPTSVWRRGTMQQQNFHIRIDSEGDTLIDSLWQRTRWLCGLAVLTIVAGCSAAPVSTEPKVVAHGVYDGLYNLVVGHSHHIRASSKAYPASRWCSTPSSIAERISSTTDLA